MSFDPYRRNLGSFGYSFVEYREPITPAGRMCQRLNAADAAIKTQDDIADDVLACLRRCQIRSRWPTWEQKA